MNDNLEWFVVSGKGPEWVRSVARSSSGELYAPAAVFGNENIIFLMLASDGTETTVLSSSRKGGKKHLYAPHSWLRKEFSNNKEMMDLLDKIEARLADQ